MKWTQITILKWNLKQYKDRLGWNTIASPQIRSNWSNYSQESRLFIKIEKNAIVEFKRRFFPRRSLKSHTQTLCGCGNELRSDWEQEIQEIWFLNSSIKSNCSQMFYIVEEHLNLYANLDVTVRSLFNPRSRALMKCIRCESLRLSRSHWIFCWPSRWSDVASIIKMHQTLAVGLRSDVSDAFRLVLILAVITLLINGWDWII